MTVKPIYIAMKQRERTKRLAFITKNRLVSPPLKSSLISTAVNCDIVSRRYLKAMISNETRRPVHCATTVPAAIPVNPIPRMISCPPIVKPRASTKLIRMFIPLTVTSATIADTLSCMPMNQPFKAIRLKVAGAAQILTKKYSEASSRTCGEQSTTRKAAFTNIHCIAIRSNAIASDIPNALERIRAHSLRSPRPYA